jgi:hypothetical protein
MLGTKGEFIGEGGGIDMGSKTGMLRDILNAFPIIINNMMKIFKALDVIFLRHDSFHWFLLLKAERIEQSV